MISPVPTALVPYSCFSRLLPDSIHLCAVLGVEFTPAVPQKESAAHHSVQTEPALPVDRCIAPPDERLPDLAEDCGTVAELVIEDAAERPTMHALRKGVSVAKKRKVSSGNGAKMAWRKRRRLEKEKLMAAVVAVTALRNRQDERHEASTAEGAARDADSSTGRLSSRQNEIDKTG